MAEYIYLPVPTAEMVRLADDIIRAKVRAGKPAPGVLRNHFVSGIGKGLMHLFQGCLRMVHQNDTVYVLLHGAGVAGSREVGAERDGVWKAYTPDQLAGTVEKEGLPKNVVDLHLLSCGSGLEGGDNPEFRDSFVARLSRALKARGYGRIRVTGYLGAVRAGAGDGIRVATRIGHGGVNVGDDWRRTVI
jgi:hypothetical protein